MNYDEMPAGPELDRLVAEGPMGWMEGLGPATVTKWWRNGTGFAHPVHDWQPSTNIAHAWEVVVALTANNRHWVDLQNLPGCWDFFVRKSMDSEPHVGHGDHAPLAICRAALKAMGSK